jgi:hypothetical protein
MIADLAEQRQEQATRTDGQAERDSGCGTRQPADQPRPAHHGRHPVPPPTEGRAYYDGPRHGYAVMEALRQSTAGRLDLPTGPIYPALRRLEQAGLIAGSWSVVVGRRRREYQLTAAGGQALAGRRADWRDFSTMVSATLEGRPCPNPA